MQACSHIFLSVNLFNQLGAAIKENPLILAAHKMKITKLYLPFILFSIYTNSLLTAAAPESSPVLDIAKNNLQTGSKYYILPVIRGRGGGLTLAYTGNNTCPLDVAQEQHEVANGLPLTLRPVNSKRGVIRVSTDLNIKFSAAPNCVKSNVWKLDNFDETTRQYFITSGGVEGNPGRETISNWFKIEEYESDYKLVFCPTVCNYCKVICRDVGIFLQDGVKRLALGDVPLIVMFRKV